MNKIWLPRGLVETASDSAPAGTYIAWLVERRTAEALAGWCKLMGIQDVVPPEEMHTTVMYSPEDAIDPIEHGDRLLPQPYQTTHYNRRAVEILGKPGSDGALVATLDAPTLRSRHLYWRDERGLRHSFPDYLPHVTLSYDASRVDPETFRRLRMNPPQLPITYDRERVSWCNQ